jgi:hypothetical protein
MAERRHDERDRLREACKRELAELREADEDEQSDVVDAAAEAAARTARRLSRPDSDPPLSKALHRTPAAKVAIASALLLLAAVAEAIRQALLK